MVSTSTVVFSVGFGIYLDLLLTLILTKKNGSKSYYCLLIIRLFTYVTINAHVILQYLGEEAYSNIFTEWKVFLRSKSPYSVWIRENTDQKNSVFGHFPRSVYHTK